MKAATRSGLAQELLAPLIGLYAELIISTLRWRRVDIEPALDAIASKDGLIALFWHGRIAQAIACRPLLGVKPRRVMISHSRDGDVISAVATHLGLPTIRGSTGREASALAKGGAGAFRAAVRAIADGGAMLITPDGPRGPARVMPSGPVQLARAARCPVFVLGLAATPALSVKTWDGARLPLPFARAVLVVAGPFFAPVRLDEAGSETLRASWEGAMNEAQGRAETLAAERPPPQALGLRLYGLITRLASPLAALWLRRRLARGKEDPERWREKLGVSPIPRPPGPLVWLHGVSVGESLALAPLVEACVDQRPGATVLVTSATRASAAFLSHRLPAGVIHQFAPLDTPAAVRAFLDHWRPGHGVLVESELWPNLILAAKARGMGLALISARLSARSLRRWRAVPKIARNLLSCFDLILARDGAAAQGLESLGGRIDGLADLKFGAAPLGASPADLSRLRAALGSRAAILGASTHPGEEEIILDAFAAAGGGASSVLVLAPRHPERGGAIEALALARGWRTGRRSAEASLADLDVYVADTVGEMGLFYRMASLAVIGGSLIEGGPGGHNPLEPARLECPFIAGRHVAGWPVYEQMVEAGATRLVDGADLAKALACALHDPQALADMGERARAFVAAGDQAAAQALAPVLAWLA